MSEQHQQLIDDFFSALNLKDLDRCQALLQELDQLAEHDPAARSWHTYLTGALTNRFFRDWAKSERLFRAVLETDIEPALRGRALIGLGIAYDYQGRWPEALQVYEQCLDIFNQPEQAIDRVKVWKNMAIVLEVGFSQGEFDVEDLRRAEKYCRLGLETLQALEDQDDDMIWLEATVWNTLILIYLNLDELDQAKYCCERCIELSRVVDDLYSVGLASNNLGEVLQRQGPKNWPEALQAYLKALEIYQSFEDEYEEIDVRANLALLYQDMGDLTTALSHYEQTLNLIEALRASVTSEMAQAGFFATIVNIYANTVLLYLEMGDQARAFHTVERARSRAFLDTLVARMPDLADEVQENEQAVAKIMNLAEVQATLPADVLLVEYFTTGLVEVRVKGMQRRRLPLAKTLIFAVTRNRIEVHDTGLSPNDLLPQQLDNVTERHFLQPQIRQTLYDRLIAPVEKELLQGKRRLYLIPHGPLHYIPFQALIAPDGETLLHETGPQLVYAPSATLLFRYGRTAPSLAPDSCLALGYNGQGTERLRFAEDEAHSVADLTNGQALVGSSSKKETLFNQATNYRFLHLACHGEFDPESPLDSFLNLAPGETLTALDVLAHLNLQCDLVTLSACESGLSQVRRGDELIGFMRAFISKGAAALVSTLWRVNDHPTRILMERFYQEIQAGVEFAEALKRAQLYVKNLSYQEALNLLRPLLADQANEFDTPTARSSKNQPPNQSQAKMDFQQVKSYLQSIPPRGKQDQVPDEPEEDEQVFADPYYWAAFVLIGHHSLESLAGE